MDVIDGVGTQEGECLSAIGDNQSFQQECYYFGTVHAIVDLMRLYGVDVVMKDINNIMSEWDSQN